MVEIIHFTNFVFDNGNFVFSPYLNVLNFPANVMVEFSIITPSKILIFSNLKSFVDTDANAIELECNSGK